MAKVDWFYLFVGLWGVVNLCFGWWLFNQTSGYPVASKYGYLVRLQLFVPYLSSWEDRVDARDREAVRNHRWRLQVWYYGVFLVPGFLMWLAVWIAYL